LVRAAGTFRREQEASVRYEQRLSLSVGLLVILVCITLSVVFYHSEQTSLLQSIDERLLSAAHFAKALLPPDYHDRLNNRDSVTPEDYDRIVERNNRLCVQLGLQYLWSCMVVDGQIVFTTSTSPEKDVTRGDHAQFFETHGDPAAFTRVFQTMTVDYSSFRNEWGHGRMVLVPFRDAQGRPYCFGASVGVDEVRAGLHHTLVRAVVLSGLLTAICLIATLLLSRRLSRPIVGLTEAAHRIAGGDLSQAVHVTGPMEIERLSQALNDMRSSISEKIDALRERTEELDRYFTNALSLLCIADTDGYFRRLSQEWADTLGYPLEELVGRRFLDFVHPDDLPATREAVARLADQKQVVSFVNRYRCRDGTYRWIEWWSCPAGKLIYAVAQDITERRQAEEALRLSQAHLHSIFRAAPTGIGVVHDRTFTEVNDRICEITGYAREELLGQSARMVYPSDEEYDCIGRERYRQTAECGTCTVETRWRRKDGKIANILLSSTPLDPDNPQAGVTFAALDITQRKQAEDEARLNEMRLEALVRLNEMTAASDRELAHFAMEEAVRLTNSTVGYLAYTSEDEQILNMYAWSKTAMAECAITDKPIVYPVVDTGLWGEAIRQRRPIITNDYETPNPLKKGYPQGHVRVQRHMNVPVLDGDRIVLVAGVGNKTEPYDESDVRQLILLMEGMWRTAQRRRAESTLVTERRRLAAILEGTNVGTWEWNIQTGETVYNQRWAEIIGYTLEEIAPITVDTWRQFTHPEDLRVSEEALQLHFRQELDIYECETRMRHKNGEWIWVLDRGKVATWTEDGRPILMSGTHQDITERKRAEAEIRDLNRGLERRVQERTADLAAVNRELEAFAYSVSHDLRAPLRAMDGFSQILLEDFAPKLDLSARDHLQRIRRGAQRMGKLIDDILALSRATRVEMSRATVDLSATAEQVLKDCASGEPERNVSWQVQPDLAARGDPQLLRLVLENLLSNAWKFTRRQPAARIEIGRMSAAEGERAGGAEADVYFVRDNGVGFDMAFAAKLFGAFQRLHRSDEFPGTGIGLATVQRIIHRHHGRVWAEAEVDRGTTIYFTLPRAEESVLGNVG
jgi:PAS domain S-box-containing protein